MKDILSMSPVIPVLVINKPEHAVPLAQALCSGGLKVLEVTLRSEYALGAIEDIVKHVPEAVVGAGTVSRADQLDAIMDAGAAFMVSPGYTNSLIEAALNKSIELLPGVSTPSEAMTVLDCGINTMKFFPAQASGGTAWLKSMAGPFPHITFCPTGGIDATSATDYLALPNVACVGGSWMAPSELVDQGDWSAIEQLAAEAARLGS